VAWYDDPSRLTYVATYKNPTEASRDADRAARHGWSPQATAATEGHVNVGRTTLKVLTLGLPFLVTGASRTKGQITITFVRTPEWLAAKQAQDQRRAETRGAVAAEKVGRQQERARLKDAASAIKHQQIAEVSFDSTPRPSRSLLGYEARMKRVKQLRDVTVGHVVEEAPAYGTPDLLGASRGSVPPRSTFGILRLEGVFVLVQLTDGPQVWLRADYVEPGPDAKFETEASTSPATSVTAAVDSAADFAPSIGEDVPVKEGERIRPSAPAAFPPMNPPATTESVEGEDAGDSLRFCGRCGKQQSKDQDRFCRGCGAPL
jgi:hypothetical protein